MKTLTQQPHTLRLLPYHTSTIVLAAFAVPFLLIQARAAIYKESGGLVVMEAENFDSRTINQETFHHWHLVPDENFVDFLFDFPIDAGFLGARGDKYMQALPDGGTAFNTVEQVGIDPQLDFKVQITTPGQYRLWLRWGGYDGASDSLYAQIVEMVSPNPGPDWYRYVVNNAGTFGAWNGIAAPSTDIGNRVGGGGGEVPAVWDLPAGTYTIRLSMREDGGAVDALILQLNSLPPPGSPGPAATTETATTFITVTQQPGDQSLAPGSTATFTVAAAGSSAVSYQWQRKAPGAASFANIPGANNTSFTTANLSASDHGAQYRAVLTITGLSIESRVATLSVDVEPPAAYRAVGSPTFDRVTIVFSEEVSQASAETLVNYTIPGLTISSATLLADGASVELRTSPQASGTVYDVSVKDIQDVVNPANPLAPNPTPLKFTAFKEETGAVLHKNWLGPTSANALEGLATFPDNPDFVTLEPRFEYPPNGSGNSGVDNYANQLSGILIAPRTGDYVFFLAADDTAKLYLSTDEDPANKKLIAMEGSWSNARQYVTTSGVTDVTTKRSDQYFPSEWPEIDLFTGFAQITLTADQRYYIEATHGEGGQGDHVSVTWQLPGDSEPVNGALPIDASNIVTLQNPDKSTATVVVTSPASGAKLSPGTINLAVNAADSEGPIRRVTYFANGTEVGASTSSPFSATWSGVTDGRYAVMAQLLDRYGYRIDSPPVNIEVGALRPLAVLVTGVTPSASDGAVQARLESLGYDVRQIPGPATQPTDANGAALIVISSTVNSGDAATKFTAAPVGIVNWETALYDELGIEANNVNGATVAGQTDIFISDATHPIAAGLGEGFKTVLSVAGNVGSLADIVSSATVVATAADGSARPALFAIEQGSALHPARIATAPARRVGLFLDNNTFVNLTEDGLKIFDEAVKWAANIVEKPALSIARNTNGSLTITFTGRLESTDSLPPTNWQAVPGSGSVTIQATASERYYRAGQ